MRTGLIFQQDGAPHYIDLIQVNNSPAKNQQPSHSLDINCTGEEW